MVLWQPEEDSAAIILIRRVSFSFSFSQRMWYAYPKRDLQTCINSLTGIHPTATIIHCNFCEHCVWLQRLNVCPPYWCLEDPFSKLANEMFWFKKDSQGHNKYIEKPNEDWFICISATEALCGFILLH